MKKLFFVVSIFFITITSSYAALFIDLQGNYLGTGEYETVTGFGGGLGFGLTEDVNLIIKLGSASNTENSGLFNEFEYEYKYVTGGIEYIPPISLLEKYRIYWKNAINLGASEFKVSGKLLEDNTLSGLMTSFHTGLQYNFTQIIAPFFDLGYHRSFYTAEDGSDVSINGLQVSVGVRLFVFGSRDFNEGY